MQEHWPNRPLTPTLRSTLQSLTSSVARWTLVVCCILPVAAPKPVWSQGGCGSVCIPLESIDPESTHLPKKTVRLIVTSEYAEFDNFRAGDDDIFNPGGNRAIINTNTFFIEYGATERFTVALMVPVVNKDQTTNRFGERVAEGIGDLALFGRYQIVKPTAGIGPSVDLGLGWKFATGNIDEPGGGVPNLPPAFQVGSGADDVIPTVSYFQAFSKFSLFGSAFMRIPVESNKIDYRFGRETEIHFGAVVPLPFWKRRLQALVSVDYLDAERDEDNARVLPARLRDGTTVLNTGGQFLDLTPGFRLVVTQKASLQARFFIPLSEDWNGLPSRNAGQVAPDLTTQLTLTVNF